MRAALSDIIFYTFVAVIVFLVLTNPKGVGELLKGGTILYTGGVTALQGGFATGKAKLPTY